MAWGVFSIGLGMALAVSLVHYFGEEVDRFAPSDNLLLSSFSAGFTVSYFFLDLLPEISLSPLGEFEFFFPLAGFSTFYVIQEYLYSNRSHLSNVKKRFKGLHSLFVFSYHLGVGILLFFTLEQSFHEGLLFFLPVLMHTAVNSLAVKEMEPDMLENVFVKFSASFSALLGFGAAYFLRPPELFSFALWGLVGGMFTYLTVHDSLNPDRDRPLGYLLGATGFIALMLVI